MAENEEKIFEYYLMLPTNARSTINDEMMLNDRCRLTRCSKQCSEEAKVSKNYIYELKFSTSFDNHIIIDVHYGKHERFHHDVLGYFLFFSTERSGKKIKCYFDQRSRRCWEVELDSSTDIAELAIEEFKCLLQRYQKIIRKLNFHDSETNENTGLLNNIDFEIEALDNLESLQISGDYDIRKIFAKVRKPLKDLIVFGEKNNAILADSEQIYQVQRKLIAWRVKLDAQQYSRLSASDVRVSIGNWTERDVFKIIRSWQDGTFHKKAQNLNWSLKDSNFDIQKLSRLLRFEDDLADGTIEIKHFGNDSNLGNKRAFLSTLEKTLYFETDD